MVAVLEISRLTNPEVENYRGFGTIGPTPADLKALRMQERLEIALSDLTEEQRAHGNTIARVLELQGIDHKIIFAANTAVVIMRCHLKSEPAPKVYAATVPYDLKGDEAVQNALASALKNHANRPSSDTMAKFVASLTEMPKTKRKPKAE